MPACFCAPVCDCVIVCLCVRGYVGMSECVWSFVCVCCFYSLSILFCWTYFSISPISAQIATNPCAHTDTNSHTHTLLSPLTTISQSETQALLGTHSHTDTCAAGTLGHGQRIPVMLPGCHSPGQL